MLREIFLFAVVTAEIWAKPEAYKNDHYMHPQPIRRLETRSIREDNKENTAEYWNKNAQLALNQRIQQKLNQNIAKNVIFFLGDGMSIPTVAAARVYIGGEEAQLAFDKFPYTALSKTYCVDHQVADSACTATAYLGGVKANLGTIGVTGDVTLNDCAAMNNADNHVSSIAKWSQVKGKKTGLVTTTRVTHASPAGLYAHTAQRDWECDSDVAASNENPVDCRDIAYQLIHEDPGRNLEVILGGGRGRFLPKEYTDEQGNKGLRSDGVNLIDDWSKSHKDSKTSYAYNRSQLQDISEDTKYLLGLFTVEHVDYNLERNKEVVPSLEEMTEAAIKVLSKGDSGYFLFVEGGRIDMAHHEAWARKALNETEEFSKAIQKAVDMTSEEDTLIVVTSDHAHTMSYSGYPVRGNDILGIGGQAGDKLPYATLNYANGPGYKPNNADGSRHDISEDDLEDINYNYPGLSPLDSETHGGDDVGIFAHGAWAHLYAGVMEQNVIPHVMAYASCVGNGVTACDSFHLS